MIGVKIEDLQKRFARKDGPFVSPADGLSLDFPAGEISAVIGESGCGKTTLLRMIAGLEKPDSGRIAFERADGMAAEPKISVVFQEHRLFPWMSVRQNVEVAVRHESPEERKRRTDAVLALMHLQDAAEAMPRELSGGMSQRVGLARALVSEPDLLLLDEAFSALDALTRRRLYDEFIRIYLKRPLTVILVTHDVTEAVLLSHRVCRIGKGRLLSVCEVNSPYPRSLSSPGVSELADRILSDFMNPKDN
jgi:ABC-type nitrate/sulfonate/bicarbonate transport system ATPase subunit